MGKSLPLFCWSEVSLGGSDTPCMGVLRGVRPELFRNLNFKFYIEFNIVFSITGLISIGVYVDVAIRLKVFLSVRTLG